MLISQFIFKLKLNNLKLHTHISFREWIKVCKLRALSDFERYILKTHFRSTNCPSPAAAAVARLNSLVISLNFLHRQEIKELWITLLASSFKSQFVRYGFGAYNVPTISLQQEWSRFHKNYDDSQSCRWLAWLLTTKLILGKLIAWDKVVSNEADF